MTWRVAIWTRVLAVSAAVALHERILSRIFVIREAKVLLDSDLAEMYGVPTKVLVQSVKRNSGRFPPDFMFQLSRSEFDNLKSQIVTSSSWGCRSTLESIAQLRRMAAEHSDLKRRIDELEKRFDSSFKAVFEAIRTLIVIESAPKKRVGYLTAGQ